MANQNNAQADSEFLSDERGRVTMLDRALEGASVEHKARVRGLLVSYGVEHDSEFYMLFVAFGHLTILVEEAPENWRALFDDFKRDLEQWTQANLQTLRAIHQQGEAADHMSQCFLRLIDSIRASSTKTSELQNDLKTLSATLQSLNSSLATVNSNSQALANRFSKTERLIEKDQTRREWISLINYGLMLLLLGGGVALSWQQRQQSERLGWLLEKANRQECVTGVKPATDPQCRQYQ